MDDVISSLDDLSPELMTRVLRKSNPDLSVRSINLTLSKQLPYSTVARLQLKYDSDSENIAEDLFLKIIPHHAVEPGVGVADAEIEFYQKAASSMPSPPIVRCIDAASSAERGYSHLLLEDLFESHYQSDESQAPEYADSLYAVEALAKCHARWWNDERLQNGISKLMSEEDLAAFVNDLKVNVAGFLDVFGDVITNEQRSAYKMMVDRAEKVWGRLTNRIGLTLTHGDCHWWNFLFPKNSPDKVYLIDWHLWHIDLGARDLAFLLALGGFAEPRPEIESDLLKRYHETLAQNGVTDYSMDDLIRDYEWSAIRNLNIPVIFWAQGKHESTVGTTLRRAFQSFERLGCRELIA
jgi:thiamine kinase-like enzyme